MKRIILALTMLLALGISGVSAQNLDEAEGLISAYGREYRDGSATTAAVTSANPDSTPEPLETEPEYKSVAILGLSFETEEDATNFLGVLRSDIEAQAEQSDPERNAEIQDLDLDKDGFLAVMNVPNTGVNTVVLFVDGNTLFLVDVTHPDWDTANTIATNVAEFVIEAEVEDEEITFNEDGTSTGGVFDRMPLGDHDLVAELTTVSDIEVLAAGEE